MTTIRLQFTKNGKIRFTSHRDVARIFERVLRQANVPMVYSEGFSPRPRVSFGLALPTGYESNAEYIDIRIDDERAPDGLANHIPEVLTKALPIGLAVTGSTILGKQTPSLQEAVTSCEWDITLTETTTVEDLHEWKARALGASSIVVERERKGKKVTDDLRPLILDLQVVDDLDSDGRPHLIAELGCRPRALRPSELTAALVPGLAEFTVRRTKQIIEREGARLDPLQDGAAPETHTQVCAS